MEPKDLNDAIKSGRNIEDGLSEVKSEGIEKDNSGDGLNDGLREAPPIGKFIDKELDRIQRRSSGDEQPIKTPWESVNEPLGGGLWSGLITLTGSTGTGKSQFSLQMAYHAALQGVPVLYVGLELGPLDLTARLLALAMAQKNTGKGPKPPSWSDLYLGKQNTADIQEHKNHLSELPFHFETATAYGWRAENLAPRVEALGKKYPDRSPIVILDYLQLISSNDPRNNDLRQRISEASYQGRLIARDLNAVVFMLSSVSRNGDKTARDDSKLGEGDPSRYVGQGKESGEIEFASDAVIALLPGEWKQTDQEKSNGRRIHLAFAKIRAGKPRWKTLIFNGTTFREETNEDRFENKTKPKQKNKDKNQENLKELFGVKQ